MIQWRSPMGGARARVSLDVDLAVARLNPK